MPPRSRRKGFGFIDKTGTVSFALLGRLAGSPTKAASYSFLK
jgi:hypothetical protein